MGMQRCIWKACGTIKMSSMHTLATAYMIASKSHLGESGSQKAPRHLFDGA